MLPQLISAPTRSSVVRQPVLPLCPLAEVSRYCSLKTQPHPRQTYVFVDDMIEKPKKGRSSDTLIPSSGRVLTGPGRIYDLLAHTKPGAGE